MKDHLRDLIARAGTAGEAWLIAREYLQARVLEALQRAGSLSTWAFLGGTALRFLYNLPRFSEDLDFSRVGGVVSDGARREEFERAISRVRRAFEAEGYDVDLRSRTEPVVQSAFVGFPGLPFDLGLSPHPSQKISIKVEVDTNPPPFATTETSIVRRHTFLNLLHYDRASLVAGKLHALICRPWAKGRDVYDLVWYLSDPLWPAPNLKLLGASMRQTGTDLSESDVAAWRRLVADRVASMDWVRVIADVEPFLEQPEHLNMLTRANVLRLLGH